VNQHLASIIDFLQFATVRGWRERVGLTLRKRRIGGRGHAEKAWGYALMRRTNPAEIDIWYTEEDIHAFIEEFETAPGKLAAKIIYATGLRIAEVLKLQLADIPSVQQFRADKAKQYIYVIGKFNKRRRVPLTEPILQDIHKFIGFERRRYASKLAAPTDLLLIGPTSNGLAAPLKARALQKEFQRAREAAQKSLLSAHLLRHHYAAHYLLRAWRARRMSASIAFDRGVAEPLLSHELIILKQNLGHSSLDTTTKYLHALGFLCGSDIPDAFAAEMMDE
jgi:integrase